MSEVGVVEGEVVGGFGSSRSRKDCLCCCLVVVDWVRRKRGTAGTTVRRGKRV